MGVGGGAFLVTPSAPFIGLVSWSLGALEPYARVSILQDGFGHNPSFLAIGV